MFAFSKLRRVEFRVLTRNRNTKPNPNPVHSLTITSTLTLTRVPQLDLSHPSSNSSKLVSTIWTLFSHRQIRPPFWWRGVIMHSLVQAVYTI